MRLALECRTELLELVQPFGDFDFCLAHEVLKNQEYAKFYKESEREKIVDNSVNEDGEPVTLEDLKKAFELVNGTMVVSPDWLGNSKKTLEAYLGCIELFGAERVIGVVQGADFKEVIACASLYKGPVAIPYDICSLKTDTPQVMGLRRALVVCNLPSDKVIHLLGFTSLEEFFFYESRPNVWSIDTGIPVLLGLEGKDILDPLESKLKPTYNLMEGKKLTQSEWTGIIRNIALLRKYIP